MAGSSRTQPQTVPDPDRKAYEQMCLKQRAYNETQEACIARKRAEALAIANNLNAVAGAGPALGAGITGDVGDAPSARAARGLTGRVGRVTGPASGAAGYDADRKAQIPKDEALIRNGVPMLIDAAVAGLTRGRSLRAQGAAELGSVGFSSAAGDFLADGWRDLKDRFRYDPYWRDRAMRASSPLYLIKALGQGR